MKKTVYLLICLFYLFLSIQAGAEEIDRAIITTVNPLTQIFTRFPNDKVILANAMKDYLVTPGDVYKIVYIGLNGPSSMEAIVGPDYDINFNIFGTLNVKGMNLITLQNSVQKMILSAYPDSRPVTILQSNGIFQVYLKGEVSESAVITCWALSRLSEIVQDKLTPYASLRDIQVVSSNGKTQNYDLFLLSRSGSRDQDTYLTPGDTIIIKRCERQVILNGQVYRPGTYQLKSGENLQALITSYGEGMTPLAAATRLRIVRTDPDPHKMKETLYMDIADPSFKDFILLDRDTVIIPDKNEPSPFIYVEGAIKNEGKINISFIDGDKLSTLLLKNREVFIPASDLKNAYVIRENEKNPLFIDIEALLSGKLDRDIPLKENDRLIIPFRQFFITVSGGVVNPGKFAYVPDRTYNYYVQLAGGRDPSKNSDGSVIISDLNDKIQPEDHIIQPEDRVYIPYSNALYHFNQWSPLITTVISAATLALAIAQLFN